MNELAIQLISQHIPSITDDNESEILGRIEDGMVNTPDGIEAADLALRTCACGQPIDGFYEYVDHLMAVLK